MSGTALDRFFVELGFEIDTKELDVFEESLTSLKDGVATLGTYAAAAAAAIGAFVFQVASGIDELGDFAEQEQVAAATIQELGYAAQLNGSSIDAVKTSIQGLNRVTGEAINGLGRGAKAFEKFGLQAKNQDGTVKTFDQLLGDVADRMDGMSRQAAISMAEKLGIDRSLIPLLLKGRAAIQAYAKEAQDLGVVTEEQIEQAGKFNDEFDRFKFALAAIARSIAATIMPRITEAITATRNWIAANKEFINNSIGKVLGIVSAALGTLWDWIYRILALSKPFLEWLFQSRTGVILLTAAIATLVKVASYQVIRNIAIAFRFLASMITVTNVAALATSAIIGGVIIALGLLIDDFVTFQEGGESVIGDLVARFPMLLEVINTISNGVRDFIDFWMQQWAVLEQPLGDLGRSLWTLASTLATTLWPLIKMVFSGWAQLLVILIPFITPIINLIGTVLVGAIQILIGTIGLLADAFTFMFNGMAENINRIVRLFTWAKDNVSAFLGMITGAYDKVRNFLGLGNGNLTIATGGAAPSTSSPSSAIGLGGGVLGNSTTNNSSQVTQNDFSGMKIEIKTDDPKTAGQSVREELNRMNSTATRNGQSAVTL